MKTYKLNMNDHDYTVTIKETNAKSIVAEVNGKERIVSIKSIESVGSPIEELKNKKVSQKDSSVVKAPIPGQVKEIFVKVGDKVARGDKLLLMEAMKLENEIHANKAGKVTKINVKAQDIINTDQILIELGDK